MIYPVDSEFCDLLKGIVSEKKIKSMVDFKDADLVDQTIREYLGYAKEDDFIIRLDKID